MHDNDFTFYCYRPGGEFAITIRCSVVVGNGFEWADLHCSYWELDTVDKLAEACDRVMAKLYKRLAEMKETYAGEIERLRMLEKDKAQIISLLTYLEGNY